MRVFMPIQKTEELSDGTLLVTGIASSEEMDADGETIKASAIEAALPDFFKYGTGALREMHQLSAAGTVDKAEVTDGLTYIETTVVDPVAITKVKNGVYKGFSVGGRATERDKLNKKLITGMRLTEISLVDRPCNPEAVISMFKVEEVEESVTKQAAAGSPTVIETAAVTALADMLNKGEVKVGDLLKFAGMPGVLDAHAALLKAVEAAGCVEGAVPVEFVAGLATERDTLKAEVADVTNKLGIALAAVKIQKAEKLTGDTLKKGMYGLSTFAELLTRVAWLTQDAAWEADIEGDSSKVPAQLREWLAQGATIFSAMTQEEVAELVASVQPPPGTQTLIVAAEPAGDVQKAAEPAADSAAEPAAAEPVAKVAEAAPVAVVQPPADDPVAKAEALTKALQADLQKALTSIETLTTRIDAMSKLAAPGKALLKALSKGEEVASSGTSAPEIDPVLKADGSVHDAATLVKATHARGGMSLAFK